MAAIFKRGFLYKIEEIIRNAFFPKENLLPILNVPTAEQSHSKLISLEELMNDGILWAVPKKRKSIEKRRTKKFGSIKYFYKMFVPKTNILTCSKCGAYHEAGRLCPKCYEKIKKETEEMQEAIQAELGISPVENEVVVLYAGERDKNPEFYKGKRIVEMEKERPTLFSRNLLQKSTEGIKK